MISYREYLLFLCLVFPFSMGIYFNASLEEVNHWKALAITQAHFLLSIMPLAVFAGILRHHPSLVVSFSWAMVVTAVFTFLVN